MKTLITTALALILIAIVGFSLSGFGDAFFFGLAGVVALIVLAELPGAAWLLRGGPGWAAGLSIYALPLIILEAWEYYSWITYCPCGDKEIQPFLMLYAYPFIVAITGTIVLVFALAGRRGPAE